ncbi:MAG: hypothetical protein FWE06_04460 [Oscillospiraceae bacterium]|nr:hypothetical protein [Oscillospiraceae bacterium]
MDDCPQSYVSNHFLFGLASYRYVQAFSSEKHDTEIFFKAFTDGAPEELRKILFYLHGEAGNHGYRIKPWTTCHGGSLRYFNYDDNWGSKTWLPVGRGTYWGDAYYTMQSGKWAIKAMPLFKRIFEKHPDKATELRQRFSEAFCGNEICFNNPSLDDVTFILECYKLEHNIESL